MVKFTHFTFKEVDALFKYDAEQGLIFWKVDKGRAKKDNEAGTTRKNNYKDIKFNGKRTSYARVCWCLYHGNIPQHTIDHIDGNPQNNRISNLRDVTHADNMKNYPVPSHNTHGYKGVKFDKRSDKWAAAINYEGERVWLGTFRNVEEAAQAYKEAEIKYFGDFRRVA